MVYPISGVEVAPWIPPLVAFCISFFTSMGGVSGAFLLLPFMVSFLGFTSPAVSPTNLVYNIVAIPSGVYRYLKEGRMAWPLFWLVVIGTLPGMSIGAVLRVKYFPDPRTFKFFVGLVLLYIGLRLIYDLLGRGKEASPESKALEAKFNQRIREARRQKKIRLSSGLPPEATVKTLEISLKKISYEFYGETFTFSTLGVGGIAFLVGIVGGAYGIGGGAILAPFFVTFFGLPVYTIAGAALGATFLASIFGVVFYQLIVPLFTASDLSVTPDWLLGASFGLGGLAGIYLGARFQRFVPARFIKTVLAVVLFTLAVRYVSQLFF